MIFLNNFQIAGNKLIGRLVIAPLSAWPGSFIECIYYVLQIIEKFKCDFLFVKSVFLFSNQDIL